jgi:NitT/TauT family transport system permease protein
MPADPAKTPTPFFALRQPVPGWAYTVMVVTGFAAVLGAWELVSHLGGINPALLPTPERVWTDGIELWRTGNLRVDLQASFLRVWYGFLLSAVVALPLGLLMGAYRLGEALFQPLTEFIRYIPVPALVPVVMIFFGIGEMSKVMLIFIGTFFQLVLMVADEVRRVPQELVQVSYTLGAKRREILPMVLLRGAMPGIFDALRLCHGWAWSYVIVAEIVAATEGMGFRVLKYYRFLQSPRIWFYLLVLGCVGLALDLLFRAAGRRIFHWADASKR